MSHTRYRKSVLAASVCAAALLAAPAQAASFDIPGGDLATALNRYTVQTGIAVFVSGDMVRGVKTQGVKGDFTSDSALSRLLSGTGLQIEHDTSGAIAIVPRRSSQVSITPTQLAQAAPPPRAAVETVTVTSSKLGGGDVQSIPIAITALSQEQLTSTQTAGGPDLVKQVPNLTFTKTNFTGYNISIRGIGTQAISATTDPAVAVAFNDVPFLRNHFFEQEFFDVSQVEVLRGPQGTLYGRNATSGVVNLVSAKPTDQWEAMASVDVGNYNNRRMEGMVNLPLIGDKLDLRVAGEWTKRDGYATNDLTSNPIDGRNLWSGRVSLLIHPLQNLSATFIYEHFDEDDNRERSTKQLCTRDESPTVINGPAGPQDITKPDTGFAPVNAIASAWLSQGCRPASLYNDSMFQTPNAGALPYIGALWAGFAHYANPRDNPYAGVTQSPDLRVISSLINPQYRAKNNTYEFNAEYNVTPDLTFTSQTAYSTDFLYSTQDFNRYNTALDYFQPATNFVNSGGRSLVGSDHEFCDPQFGCTSRLVVQDISQAQSTQFYQELRLASKFSGPFNFSVGGNYMNYQTIDDYYVLSNALTLAADADNHSPFLVSGGKFDAVPLLTDHLPFDAALANDCNPQPANAAGITAGLLGLGCGYIDPNPLNQIDGEGHNYFRSKNPFRLHSWAIFGEAYYDITPDIKLTGGLRFTDDRKDFDLFPSWALLAGKGYPQAGTINQEWKEFTGRAVINWTPKLDFTDQTLVYASYAHGYKGGGANPPGVAVVYSNGLYAGSPESLTHPKTFEPEFNNAFELGTKNKMLDSAITLNANVFYYKYKNYQISEIVDRTAINFNYNASVRGAEVEAKWEPLPGLKFGLTGGYENATLDDHQSAIDLMDRTAGHTDWMVVKPFFSQTSNCVLPTATINEMIAHSTSLALACFQAYSITYDATTDSIVNGIDVGTGAPYKPNPPGYPGYAGFDPTSAPNHGEGFTKDIGGNQLPNAPHFTTSLSAEYTMPVSSDWVGTLHGDFYYQSGSYWRIFNDMDFDKLRGYTNINMALIFTNQNGWQAMAYVKNLMDTTAITGAFLNSDDTALTTNIFTTDPRLFGIRITKNW